MEKRSIGISIDALRVTVVETLGATAVSVNSATAKTLSDSLDAALAGIKQKRTDTAFRVALIAPSITLRRLDVTADIVASRAKFEEVAFNLIPVDRKATSLSGAFYDTNTLVGDNVTSGVAVIAPVQTIIDVYQALGNIRAEVVASPLALTGVDGVWLGIHNSVTEVTVIENGKPTAYRQLRAGGLSGVAASLVVADDWQSGYSRLLGELTGVGPDDVMARTELGRYANMITAELNQTLDFWHRSGEVIPALPTVTLYGLGGGSVQCRDALIAAGFTTDLPDTVQRALTHITPSARPDALSAYGAAVSLGNFMPQVSFINPRLASVISTRKRRRKRLGVVGIVTVVVASIFFWAVRPVLNGWQAASVASESLSSAEAEFNTKSGVYHQTMDFDARQAVVASQQSSEPRWSDVYTIVLNSLPPGASIGQVSLTATPEGVVASTTVDLPNGSYTDLVNWLTRLRTTEGVSKAWSAGFSVREGTASFLVSMQISLAADAAPVQLLSPFPFEIPPPAPLDTVPMPDTSGVSS